MSTVDLLISCEEASRHLEDPKFLFIDVRPWRDYEKGHLPPAVNIDLFSYHWVDTSTRGIESFTRHMERLFASAGVSLDKRVIFYEDVSGIIAARGLWVLHYLGHDAVSILDGGMRRWVKLSLPVDKSSKPTSPAVFRASPRKQLLAGYENVASSLRQSGKSLLDARSSDEYYGVKVRAARRGCIPGAVNMDWEMNLNKDGTFKTPEALEALYREAGIPQSNEVITYCQGGYRSAHAYVALLLAGYRKISNYIGSWAEWGNRLDLPVELPKKTGQSNR